MKAIVALQKGSGLQVLLLPILAMLAIFLPLVILRPNILQYQGLQILLNMAIPLSLATVAQMFAMAIGEIDFSLGSMIGLVTCVVGTTLPSDPVLGIGLLVLILVLYMLIGAFLYWRKVSSIVITIGLSFVWTGLAVTIQPSPGGDVPQIIQDLVGFQTPVIPTPLVFLAVLAVLGHLFLFRTRFGILIRGIGGNIKAVSSSGHSVAWLQAGVFGLVGLFGILAGTALAGITTSADANMAANYTLLTVAGVMLGGGSFSGGKASAAGAVLGAVSMTLVGTLLTFLRISPDWQIGSQGFILLLVLFLNGTVQSSREAKYV